MCALAGMDHLCGRMVYYVRRKFRARGARWAPLTFAPPRAQDEMTNDFGGTLSFNGTQAPDTRAPSLDRAHRAARALREQTQANGPSLKSLQGSLYCVVTLYCAASATLSPSPRPPVPPSPRSPSSPWGMSRFFTTHPVRSTQRVRSTHLVRRPFALRTPPSGYATREIRKILRNATPRVRRPYAAPP